MNQIENNLPHCQILPSDKVFISGVKLGVGGLGRAAELWLWQLANSTEVTHVFSPGSLPNSWSSNSKKKICWHLTNRQFVTKAQLTWSPLRWLQGERQFVHDQKFGKWVRSQINGSKPTEIFAFTQVAFEVFKWATSIGVPCQLLNPNLHIEEFYDAYKSEAIKRSYGLFFGHPCKKMIKRVSAEYVLASKIVAVSELSKKSMVSRGVESEKIDIVESFFNFDEFSPPKLRLSPSGPLRVIYVGTLDFRKGFLYLLEALRRFPPNTIDLELYGTTGDTISNILFKRASKNLTFKQNVGDTKKSLHWAEVMVTPSLEEGFCLAVGEAMAAGIPVIVTNTCGVSEWVTEGESGWVIPSKNVEAIVESLNRCLQVRDRLVRMGQAARETVLKKATNDFQR